MKRNAILAAFLVLVFCSYALAFGLGTPKATKHELKLSDLGADLAKYEGGDLDPVKDNADRYIYKTFDDKDWDGLAEQSAKTLLAVDFADMVLKSDAATLEDAEAAYNTLEPYAEKAPGLKDKVMNFVSTVQNDPKKAPILTEAKSVGETLQEVVEKAPDILSGLKDSIDKMKSDADAAAGGQ